MNTPQPSIHQPPYDDKQQYEETYSEWALHTARTCIHSFDSEYLVPDTVRAGLHGLRAEVTVRFPDIAEIAADDGSWWTNADWEVQDILDSLKPAYARAIPLVSAAADTMRDTPFDGYTDDYWQYVVDDLRENVWNVVVHTLNNRNNLSSSSYRTDNASILMILCWVVGHDRLAEYLTATLQSMFIIEQYHFSLTVTQRTDIIRNHVMLALYRTMEVYDMDTPFEWQSPLLVTHFTEHCADGELFSAVLYEYVAGHKRFKHHNGLHVLAQRVEAAERS